MKRSIPAFLIMLSLFACSSHRGSILPKDKPIEYILTEKDTLIEGTVRYVKLEGGVWCIEDSKGNLYIPQMNTFPEHIKRDGLKGTFVVEILRDQNSYIMFGTAVKLKASFHK